MAIIGSLPYTLTNGQTADATQVMADFNAIVNNVNANAAALTSVIGDGYNYAADTGTVNNVVISPSTGAPASYVDGGRMRTKSANTNTSSTMTVKFGSLGTKSVVIDQAGTLPPVGSYISGMHYWFEYDSTQDKCILMNPSRTTSSFTGTLNGMTTTITGTLNYAIEPSGKFVNMWAASAIVGTSNATTMSLLNVPAAIQPATTKRVPQPLEDAGGAAQTAVIFPNASSTFNLNTGSNIGGSTSGGFTASGTKGIPAFWAAQWALD